jgi:uncharacterized membrane protein YdbT with pleckstrin-like domain
MYNSFRRVCERVLRIPPDPGPPPGDEKTTRVFRASPNYFRYLFVLWAMRTAVSVLPIVIIAAVFVSVSSMLPERSSIGAGGVSAIAVMVLFFVLLQRLLKLAVLRLDYEKRWYVVTDRSLRVREGVFSVQEMTVMFANIQNLSISQGPIQRLLKVADLKVDTAGGGGEMGHGHHEHLHTAWFRGIDNADQVRQLIQDRLRRLKDTGLGDHDDTHEDGAQNSGLTLALRELHREASALRAVVERI